MKILIIIWAVGVEFILACMIVTWCFCYGLTGVSHYERKTRYRTLYGIMLDAGMDDKYMDAVVYRPLVIIRWVACAWLWPVITIARILGI